MLIACRDAEIADEPFIVEMAREASTIEDRPLPAADSAVVRAVLPTCVRAAMISQSADSIRLGAAWWHWHEPPLARDSCGQPLPEMILAVAPTDVGAVWGPR